jgi:hypothetical protein
MVDSEFIKGDYDALVRLHRALKSSLMELRRAEVAYEQNLEKSFFIEDLYNNKQSKTWKIQSDLTRPR